MERKPFVIKNCGDRWGKNMPWQEPNNCPYCNLPNSELFYDLVEDDDGNKYDVVDCPRCKNRLFWCEY